MARKKISIGVVTVTFNSAGVLRDFFDSINAQSFQDFRLYLIDNKSRDTSADDAESLAECNTVVVRNLDNLGVAEGNNQGIRMAMRDGCSHVLLINNDIKFGPDLFAGLAEMAEQHDVVVPKIHYNDEPPTLWYGGGGFAKARGFVGVHYCEGQVDAGQCDKGAFMDYSPTCCMLVSTAVFDRVGLMDPRYFVYYDDTDFCLRLLRAGVPIWYAPQLSLRHKVGSLTGGNVSAFGARMGARNKVYYIRKHFGFLLASAYLVAFLAYLLCRAVLGRDSYAIFKVKIAAYIEGFRVGKRPPLKL